MEMLSPCCLRPVSRHTRRNAAGWATSSASSRMTECLSTGMSAPTLSTCPRLAYPGGHSGRHTEMRPSFPLPELTHIGVWPEQVVVRPSSKASGGRSEKLEVRLRLALIERSLPAVSSPRFARSLSRISWCAKVPATSEPRGKATERWSFRRWSSCLAWESPTRTMMTLWGGCLLSPGASLTARMFDRLASQSTEHGRSRGFHGSESISTRESDTTTAAFSDSL
mmetsp:Transcript_9397/g.26362  ORF Transcript_9397/g.26362 Transcript_9397/m.26362 type:complete len:224 (-) Transcript_9397:571-1242(-)